jgi:hypothetical protein
MCKCIVKYNQYENQGNITLPKHHRDALINPNKESKPYILK